jgi:class I fructose-bisphosphate aldolase
MTAGLHNLPKTIAQVVEARPDALTMVEGTAIHCWPPHAGKLALIIQMGCFTPDDRITETLGSIEGIVRIGADAVAMAIGVRGDREGYYLRVLSDTVTKAERFGLPVIAHIYPRAYDGDAPVIVADAANIAWAVRCGIECGADIIKVIYPGDVKAFEEIIDSCPVPVVAAGGPRTETFEQALRQAEDIINSGASGLTVGRNVWAPDRNTFAAVTAYKLVVHDRVSPKEAIEMGTDLSRDQN